jgi:hypothetical protein
MFDKNKLPNGFYLAEFDFSGSPRGAERTVSAARQDDIQRRRFEGDLVVGSLRTGDPNGTASNLELLVNSGLITGDTAAGVRKYLTNRTPAAVAPPPVPNKP